MNNILIECENCKLEIQEEYSLNVWHEYVKRDILVCPECYDVFLHRKVMNRKTAKHQITLSPLVQFAADLSIDMKNGKYRPQSGSQRHLSDSVKKLAPPVPWELVKEIVPETFESKQPS